MRITSVAAIAASGARVLAAGRLPALLQFSTDTRSLAPGDAFVALRGEHFDGHAYIARALDLGASVLVVDDERVVPAGVPALVVADTRAAYLAFAGAARRASSARIVAVTGSAGKTTTKAFVAQILERLAGHERVFATPRNENNEIGVAKLLLGMSEDAAFGVVEFGARHYGEIEPLARAALPEVAILTNVGDAHLEIFGSHERLADTKWGIFATGAAAVLNSCDEESLARAASLPARPVWFGTEHVAGPGDDATRVLVLHAGESDALAVIGSASGGRPASGMYGADISVPGEHNRQNIAAAAAAVVALGFPPGMVAATLSSLALPSGRYERIELDFGDVIYDAYNASMSGTLATLSSFASEAASRRIAVLGGMAELGDDAPRMHAEIGAAAARSNLDRLLVGGEFAAEIAQGALDAGFDRSCIVRYSDNGEAISWLLKHRRSGDLVLLKASRRYRLEEIVEGLRAPRAAG
jgi:UDP-N-acetylmuramoyl-tripeptide--D-alanyl-D-alanine ligase